MSFLKRFTNAFIWNHLNKISGYLLDFALSIVLARGLGDYYYGIYSEFVTFVFLFSMICSIGLDTALNAFIPRFNDQPGLVSGMLRRSLVILSISSSTVAAIVIFAGGVITRLINSPELNSMLTIAAFYIVLHNFLIVARMIIVSFYATRFLFFMNGLLKGLLIIASYIIIKMNGNIRDVISGFTIISFFVSIAFFLGFLKYLKPPVQETNWGEFLKFSVTAWFNKIINYVLGRYFDIFILGFFSVSKEKIGYYNIAFSIAMALFLFISSGFDGISLAAFSDFENKQQRDKIARGWLTIAKVCIIFGFPGFLYVIRYAKIIITTIYSTAFIESATLFQVFAGFYLLAIILGNGMNLTVIYALKKANLALKLRLIGGAINIALDILLVPKYQALGAIIATGISIVGIVALEHAFVRKYISFRYPLVFLTKIVLATLVALGTTSLFEISNALLLVLNIALFIFVFILSIYIFKPLSDQDKEMIRTINAPLGQLLKHF
ncbi:oligosaccharide flippase family protein [candidate division KSB1 bacterium]|nr:oligosaccharide flippase family protein [candidate division KSB1 bacterium]